MLLLSKSMNLLAVLALLAGELCGAAEPAGPKPRPPTRDAMKQALDRLKQRQPRLPVPPISADDKEKAGGDAKKLVNNGRMRNHYLSEGFRKGFSRDKDPQMTLDYPFTVEFFWIASRVNNCHYCLGHQENKLLTAGDSEDRIAALDCDWSVFTDKERAAFAFALKLSLEPEKIGPQDVEALGKFYPPKTILEIAFDVAAYNAMNRWTDALGIPQEDHRSFITPTPAALAPKTSLVAPQGPRDRGPLETRSETLARLDAARQRKAVLPLADEADARKLLSEELAKQPIANWVRLLANFPVHGKARIEGLIAVQTKGKLPPQLKAEMDWAAAREDRAWYALSLAKARLAALGWSEDQIFALDEAEAKLPAGEQAAVRFARKLTSTPQVIVDEDIAELRKHFGDFEVAEIVHHITQAAFLDRVTEAAQLPLDVK